LCAIFTEERDDIRRTSFGKEALLNTRELQRSMYELRDSSVAQRVTLAGIAAVLVALVRWLLLGNGIHTAGRWFGWTWQAGDPVRRICIATALSIYYVRILFTEFVFLKRGVSWTEVFTIVPWMFCIYILLAAAGGLNTHAMGITGGSGVALFVAGSWMNSWSEYTRHVWKERPGNRGRLYTGGLFRFSRHPNYLGDLTSFSGLCLISEAWVTALIPLTMLAGFVLVSIPVLDSHLGERYGSEFKEYAKRTSKLIPFVY